MAVLLLREIPCAYGGSCRIIKRELKMENPVSDVKSLKMALTEGSKFTESQNVQGWKGPLWVI